MNDGSVRHRSERDNLGVGPCADRIKIAVLEPFNRLGNKPFIPVLTILPVKIGPCKVVMGNIFQQGIVMALNIDPDEKLPQPGIIFRRQFCKYREVVAQWRHPGILGPDTCYAMGPEEVSFGIDKPPFTLVFPCVEKPGCFKAGAHFPASVFREACRPVQFRRQFLLGGNSGCKILVGVDFSGPVAVHILAVFIDKGNFQHRSIGDCLEGKHPGDFKTMLARAVTFDLQVSDQSRVDGMPMAAMAVGFA